MSCSFFFKITVISGLITSSLYSYDPGLSKYKCNPKEGAESRLSVLPGGNYICTYAFQDGTERSISYSNPQYNSSFAKDIAATMIGDANIKKLPVDQRRLAAAKKVLSSRSLDPNGAKELLEYVDSENDRENDESVDSTIGYGASEALDPIRADKIATINQTLKEASDLAKAPSKTINISEKDIDSHSEFQKTIPAILTGLLTLDPKYFEQVGGKSNLVNNVGEITINPDLIKVYYQDHTKDSFLAKNIDKMAQFLLNKDSSEQIAQFKPVEFMDQQVLGFLVYLMVALHTGYMKILYYVFLVGTMWVVSSIFLRSSLANILMIRHNAVMSKMMPGWVTTEKEARELKPDKHLAMAFALVFFLAPSFKMDISTAGGIEKAIYSEGTNKSISSYSYATPAQEFIRYCAQSGNLIGNQTNDYAMKAYIALLNFKMGFVKDGLPKYIGEVSAEVAQIEADKAKLAASSALYNNYCKPYKDGEKFNIPSSAQNRISASIESPKPKKIAFIGDRTSIGIYNTVNVIGAQKLNLGSNSMGVDSAKKYSDSAIASEADMAIVSFGIDDLKSGPYAESIANSRWKETFDPALSEIILPLKQNGARVVCIPPAKTKDPNLNTKIEAVKSSFRSICGTTIELPALNSTQMQSDGIYPNADGYKRISEVITPKIGGIQADRIDAAACKKLEDEITLGSKALIKRATIASEKADSVHGFAENIKKTSGPTPTLTTNPNEVLYKNRVVRGDVNWYSHGYSTGERGTFGSGAYGGKVVGSNNKNGFFRVPMSPQKPGWTAVGDVSYYGKVDASGKLEAGTTEQTASGDKIRDIASSGALVAANWHLPLNTIVAVKSANGQTYHFRTIDRGPLVVFDGNGNRPVRGPENPWSYSTKFFDLTPKAMEKMCFMTNDRTTFTVIAYNAPAGYNPPQPNQNPDGTITIDKSKCQKKRKLLGQNLARTFGPTTTVDNGTYYQPGDNDSGNLENGKYEYVTVDDSPLRSMKDFIQLVAFTNNNFGWMSAAMVPTSYEFFKYINMYFVQNATGQMNSLDSTFAETTKGQFDEIAKQDDGAGISAAMKYIYKDLIVSNGTWFIVPGFNAIFESVKDTLKRIVFANDRVDLGKGGSSVAKSSQNISKNMLRAFVAGTLSVSAGGVGGFASNGEAGIGTGKSLLAGMAIIAAMSDSYEAHQVMMFIIAFLTSIAIVVFMVSVFTLMAITTFIIIKMIFYFISVILFFMSAPIVGIKATFDGKGIDYFKAFIQRALILMITPLLIIFPIYLFIPVSELMRGLMISLIKMVLVVMDKGGDVVGDAGLTGSISKITLIASLEGLVGILSIFMTFIVTFILLLKFREWVMDKIGIDGDIDMTSSAMSQMKKSVNTYVAPI